MKTTFDFDALWNFSQPAQTEKVFRDLLPQIEVEGDLDTTLQLMTQIARTLGLQHRYAEAHTMLDIVSERLTTDTPIAHIRYYLERGRVFNSDNQRANAVPLFHEAVEMAIIHHQDVLQIDALHMLAIVDTPASQLNWNRQALAVAQQSTLPAAILWQGSLFNNIGWNYFDRGEYAQALTSFEQALQWREQQGKLKEILIARWCVARTLRALHRAAEALAMQYEIRSAWLAAQEIPDGYGSEEIAESLLELGQAEAARPYFAEAYTRFSTNNTLADQPDRLARIKSLS